MNSVGALRVAEPRGSRPILSAIQHHEFATAIVDRQSGLAGNKNYRGIKGAGGFPAVILRGKDRSVRNALPRTERAGVGVGPWRFSFATRRKHQRREDQYPAEGDALPRKITPTE